MMKVSGLDSSGINSLNKDIGRSMGVIAHLVLLFLDLHVYLVLLNYWCGGLHG